MPKLINNFVLKCHPEKHERFASAGELLEPWKDVMDQVSVGAPPQSRAHREPFAEGIQQFYDDQPGTPTLGLNVGADVEIHALQKRPELNGVCGKIVKRQDGGRLQVKTATGEELALKPANLRPVSKLILTPGQVLSPEESQRLGFPPGAGLVLSTGEMLSREACQSMGLPPGGDTCRRSATAAQAPAAWGRARRSGTAAGAKSAKRHMHILRSPGLQ